MRARPDPPQSPIRWRSTYLIIAPVITGHKLDLLAGGDTGRSLACEPFPESERGCACGDPVGAGAASLGGSEQHPVPGDPYVTTY